MERTKHFAMVVAEEKDFTFKPRSASASAAAAAAAATAAVAAAATAIPTKKSQARSSRCRFNNGTLLFSDLSHGYVRGLARAKAAIIVVYQEEGLLLFVATRIR
uniref:Uncharacterized protein n=1 Tax=Vespula pensylvanica TaxID=30213 RepID=A0A834KZD5_VESPE|nr:hypothetical protein H0235_012802 [Vespula pensylvanica]